MILRQDPELSPGATASAVVIAADDEGSFDALLSVAEPLAQRPARELIVTRLLGQGDRLATATSELAELRSALADRGVTARVAAYVAGEAGAEAARFATEHKPISCSSTQPRRLSSSRSSVLPAMSGCARVAARPAGGRHRDGAGALPADAPGVVEAARDARLIVIGRSDRWRTEGIGAARLAVAEQSGAPTLVVRRGLRPSCVAPSETMTRFTSTLGPQHPAPRPQ